MVDTEKNPTRQVSKGKREKKIDHQPTENRKRDHQ